MTWHWTTFQEYIEGLVQGCSNSSTLALGLVQSCTKPSIYTLHPSWSLHKMFCSTSIRLNQVTLLPIALRSTGLKFNRPWISLQLTLAANNCYYHIHVLAERQDGPDCTKTILYCSHDTGNWLDLSLQLDSLWDLVKQVQITLSTDRRCFRTTKRKYLHFDDIDGLMQERRKSIANALELCLSCTNPSILFITCCTESCHFDNFQCSHWWNFHQNDNISVSVYLI